MYFSLGQLAKQLEGELVGDSDQKITKPAKIEEAEHETISFIASEKYSSYISASKSSAFLVSKDFDINNYPDRNFILVENVYDSLSNLLQLFQKQSHPKGIHKSAHVNTEIPIHESVSIQENVVIRANVTLGENVIIYPNVFIGNDCHIGSNTVIYSGVKIYHNTLIGNDCIIHSNTVVGSDGFGFAPQADGSHKKIPQIGGVQIGNNVEIGANCTIDRASMGMTKIGDGVKLDNLVQIAHNVEVGDYTAIAAQSGIAGSTKIGKYCMFGGQSAVIGHIEVADKTMLQAKSGIGKSIKKEGTKWYGVPAIDYGSYLRSYVIFKNLPTLKHRIDDLEKTSKDK